MTRRAALRRTAIIPAVVFALVSVAASTATADTTPNTGLVGGLLNTTGSVLENTTSALGVKAWLTESGTTTTQQAADAIGATSLRTMGIDGKGVGVALIDTGVVPVPGLTSGNLVNGPDLSFESQNPDQAYLDTFGHGTHMAGIIAGNQPGTLLNPGFKGIAPGVKLTSIKTASTEGAVDVSQVIAAVDWVVQHRNDDPANPIRVINLSYGTDGVQDYRSDPLTHAIENAWRAGIVVVVAGGNSGTDQPRLNNPAYDPYVLAVGAADIKGTTVTALDDVVPPFSSRGDAARRVDLVAPGKSIVSLRNPGSAVDEANPQAVVNTDYFKGSGSSQAAAVTSGAVALLLQARPNLTPDQVKALLRSTASAMPLADAAGQGQGELNVFRAAIALVPFNSTQTWPKSTGLGSIEAARGAAHVGMDDVELTGENTILGPFDASTWAPASAAFNAWNGGFWAGQEFTGDSWGTDTWTGKSWTGKYWGGKSWTGKSWTEASWTGKSWTGKSWTGKSWTGTSWTGKSWTGKSWTSANTLVQTPCLPLNRRW